MDISLDFTDTEAMEKWIDQAIKDRDWIGKIGTANILEVLIEYKEYFEGNILDDSQKLNYLWYKVNNSITIFTYRLVDITLGKITVLGEI